MRVMRQVGNLGSALATTILRAYPTAQAFRGVPVRRLAGLRFVARGKLRKVAVVAATRKLLPAVYSIAKSRRPFVPHLTPQETPA
jgi:hypothetical protein